MDCQFVEAAVGYFLLFHARSKCVCISLIYTVVIVCKYEFCCVWKHHKVRNVFDHL